MINMKYSIILSLLISFSVKTSAQRITIGTYNLRLDKESDIGNLWINRAPVIANLIRFHGFDILGTQEGLKNQLDDLSASLPEFDRYGIPRGDLGGHSAIFFKKEKYKLLKGGDFWLSETPEKPSIGWDACSFRLLTWVHLKDIKTGKTFYFFNTHLDSRGEVARQNSAKLILQKIHNITRGEPVIFTGDLNGSMKSEPYLIVKKSGFLIDTFNIVKDRYINNGSTNAFGKSVNSRSIIDHVFVSKDFTASRWGILTDTYQGKYPSDHFPILVDVMLK